jgi:hypothetical protein
MALILDGTTGVPVTTVTGTLPVANGGTGVTTSTGTGANVLGTSPTITGATITVAATAAPAFSAYLGTLQSIAQNTFTKVSFNTEEFDTNSNYDSVTNYRFTPTVAGYYQVNTYISYTTGQGTSETVLSIYKNGSAIKQITDALASSYTYGGTVLVYLNGSTDYIEAYTYTANAGTRAIVNSSIYCYFQAAMVRSA